MPVRNPNILCPDGNGFKASFSANAGPYAERIGNIKPNSSNPIIMSNDTHSDFCSPELGSNHPWTNVMLSTMPTTESAMVIVASQPNP